MNRKANMLTLGIAIICANIMLGCANYNKMPAKFTDEQVLESFRKDPRIDFRWYGNNKWRLKENGFSGGGHDPYEVHPKTDRLFSYPHGRLLWGKDVRIIQNPTLLYPLFDSLDSDVVIAALYCYSKEPIYGYWAKETPKLTADQYDLASHLRRLISEHRDVRVRCMAANILMKKILVTIDDIDCMLSDENLSVQIMGIRSIASIKNNIVINEHEHFSASPRPTEADNKRFSRTLYPGKRLLIPILLKHLNDNHFYIRASCYSYLVNLLEHRKYLANGRVTIERPDMLKGYFQWERESWWKCRDKQQELISWWQDNSESILNNSGPTWHVGEESAAVSLKTP